MVRRFVVLILILILCIGFVSESAFAAINLPPLPNQAIINSVLTATNGAQFTPLNAPNYVMNKLGTFTGVFANVKNKLNTQETVHYITMVGKLTETVIPLANSTSAVLTADMTAPGTNPLPGKIIGALFQPSRGTMVVVAVFEKSTDKTPKAVRFYYNSTQYYESTLLVGKFKPKNGSTTSPDSVDAGSVIAHQHTCVTVGLQQVCWTPYSYADTRDGNIPKNLTAAAATQFKLLYSNLTVQFSTTDGVPDLWGGTLRSNCASQLSTATNFNFLTSCFPNLYFAASKTAVSGQPIAVFVVTKAADVRAYKANGTYVGVLPAGNYLVMDATPNVTTPGQPAVLFLVNSDTVNHYLIPSTAVQGFGDNAILDERQAAIRDGLAAWRGFGR